MMQINIPHECVESALFLLRCSLREDNHQPICESKDFSLKFIGTQHMWRAKSLMTCATGSNRQVGQQPGCRYSLQTLKKKQKLSISVFRTHLFHHCYRGQTPKEGSPGCFHPPPNSHALAIRIAWSWGPQQPWRSSGLSFQPLEESNLPALKEVMASKSCCFAQNKRSLIIYPWQLTAFEFSSVPDFFLLNLCFLQICSSFSVSS